MSIFGRLRRITTEIVLWAAALLGLVSIVLVILAWTMNISLIMFRTGSMEPTIPAGSVAVVREVPAAEVSTGDIVTVDRPGELPVTHRVISVAEGDSSAERVITMQGDANTAPDPHPYTITEARTYLTHVPHVATAVNQLGNPWVLGSVTLAASILVGWAFWPRDDVSAESAGSKRADSEKHAPRHRRTS